MSLSSFLRSAAAALFHHSRLETEMDEELRAHIQHRANDLERSGVPRAEAERRARLDFGGYQKFTEECREALGTHFVETLLQDIRYGLRMLRKSPGFTTVAVLTLALGIGIGANTAIFSVLDAVVLRPLPFASPNRLVHLTGKFALGDQAGIPPPDYVDYREANRTFDQMAVLNYETPISNLSGSGKPEQVTNSFASWNLFDALKLKSDVTLDQAQADLDSDAKVIDAKFPDTNKGWGIKIRPLASVLIGPVQFDDRYGVTTAKLAERALVFPPDGEVLSIALTADCIDGDLSCEHGRIMTEAAPTKRSAQRHKRYQSYKKNEVIPHWKLRP